jgi:hypothetical protein
MLPVRWQRRTGKEVPPERADLLLFKDDGAGDQHRKTRQ